MITAGSATPAWGSQSLTLQRQSIRGPRAAMLPRSRGQPGAGEALSSCSPRASMLPGSWLWKGQGHVLLATSTSPAAVWKPGSGSCPSLAPAGSCASSPCPASPQGTGSQGAHGVLTVGSQWARLHVPELAPAWGAES